MFLMQEQILILLFFSLVSIYIRFVSLLISFFHYYWPFSNLATLSTTTTETKNETNY